MALGIVTDLKSTTVPSRANDSVTGNGQSISVDLQRYLSVVGYVPHPMECGIQRQKASCIYKVTIFILLLEQG